VLLDWGVIGCIIFLALFLAAGVIGLIFAVVETVEDWEISMIAPASINMFSFLVIKSVFNQVDNHLLFFSVLGMICAFIWRARQERLPEPVVERQTRARLVRSPRARLGLNG
jgi:4-amino-4-deoxy-L-arabinose transferase-like glycosyltransferase